MKMFFKKVQIMLVAYACLGQCYAAQNIDLFGDDSSKGQEILSIYSHDVKSLANLYNKIDIKYQHNIPEKIQAKIQKKRKNLQEAIKHKGHYIYADYESVYYPDENKSYITIEVIKPEEKNRLQWVKVARDDSAINNEKNDIIKTMQNYVNEGVKLILSQQLDVSKINCESNHCLFGFDHPNLKPYKNKFAQGVIRDKALIINTIRKDKDPRRRAAAVFLVGEFKSAQEIVSLLRQYVSDGDDEVRNNVMRVIASTMHKSGIKKIDVKPFIALLDSPYEADRNKALFVLYEAADLPDQNKTIRLLAENKLKLLANLKQPNNKIFAMQILDKIRT